MSREALEHEEAMLHFVRDCLHSQWMPLQLHHSSPELAVMSVCRLTLCACLAAKTLILMKLTCAEP